MYVFRMHVRPGGGSASMADTFAYCLNEKILGVGWRTTTNTNTTDWDVYYAEAAEIHENLNVCKYIKNWVVEGSLVWTRDPTGNYYLARVVSGWEYFTTGHSKSNNIDIGNIFRVELKSMSIDEVPGKVVASFRPPRTIQEICDPTAIAYSKFVWNRHAGQNLYDIDDKILNAPDVFSLLDSEEVEDLVFLYLQHLGWFVVPQSRKADTLAFEYLVVKPHEGVHAQVQVKTGGSTLNRDLYVGLSFHVILFQSNELYTGTQSENITCLSRAEVLKFVEASAAWLPARYRTKMGMLRM